ncbi:MAG: hypothetical protein K2N87_07885 [Eubacterium sp.]|nr:hypothetical protein [Eubacterium sp.]
MNNKYYSITTKILFIVVNFASFPLVYVLPLSNGLDQSWIFALNYINNNNAKFGEEHFFTYGPLGFLGRCQFVGNNLYIGILFWILVGMIQIYLYKQLFSYARYLSVTVIASVLIFFALPVSEADIYLCFLVLIALLLVYRYGEYISKWIAVFLSAVIFLFKFSGTLLLIATLILLIFCAVAEKKSWKIIGIFIACMIIGPISYLVYHPSIRSLFRYARAAAEISLGYNKSMSLDVYEAYYVWVILIVACYVFMLLYGILKHKNDWKYLLILAPACFFWYKEGFVRNDGHYLLALSGLLLICTLLVFFVDIKEWLYGAVPNVWSKTMVCSFCMMAIIPIMGNGKTLSGSLQTAAKNIFNFPKLLQDCGTQDLSLLQQNNKEFMGMIGNESYTTFPWEITENISYGNSNFVIAPLLQNYTIYTPFLDRLNARFYTGSDAPEYIILDLATIDGRLPLIETPATWEQIYKNYCVVASNEEKFLLKKRERSLEKDQFELNRIECRIDKGIQIPEGCSFVKIETRLGMKGSLENLFYKILPVNMEVAYLDGTVKTGRVILENLAEGIGVASLVWDNSDFQKYMNMEIRDKTVTGITLTGPGIRQYADTMEVTFYGGNWK